MVGRLLDFALLCAVGIALFAVAVWLWPYLGPVGIAVAIILAIIPGNVLYARASRRGRSAGESPRSDGDSFPSARDHRQRSVLH